MAAKTHTPDLPDPAFGKVKAISAARPFVWSLAGLIMGVVAIGLACLPALAFEQALPDPFTEPPRAKPFEQPVEAAEAVEKPTGGLTFKYKNFSVTLGGKAARDNVKAEAQDEAQVVAAAAGPEPVVPPVQELAFTHDPARWFMILAVCTGLAGIVVAAVGQVRERHGVLTSITIACCAAAITWQYFAVGIAMGAAIAALIMVLLVLSSLVGGS